MQYAIVEIAGKQVKVEPEKEVLVSFIGETGDFECEKVLLIADGDKLEIGDPLLKKKFKFSILGTTKNKIRVSKYHAKANTRKVRGSKEVKSRIVLA